MSETELQVITRAEFDALKAEVAEHRTVHVSRRGVQGAQGERGEVGPQGAPADPRQSAELAVEIVTKKFASFLKELAAEATVSKAAIHFAVIEELRTCGFLDANGNVVSGPAGKNGADSQVPGRDGVDGKSIKGDSGPDGRPGRDARVAIGSITSGDVASVTLREENGVQVLDFVLPRGAKGDTGATGASIVGPKGDSIVGPVGPEGLRGYPGENGLSKEQVIALILDMKKRGTFRD